MYKKHFDMIFTEKNQENCDIHTHSKTQIFSQYIFPIFHYA